MQLPLLALAMASFGIGTTEFVIMGLLPEVAADLSVTIPAAGLLVTGYALGVVVGAPIVAIITNALPRKATLIGLASVFVVGNFLCAVAPDYWFLMAARVVTAFCHGAFFGIGAVVAASLVPPNQRASAIALMFAGLTLANVLGVPLGTALGQALGWRSTFWAVVIIGIAAVSAIAIWVPRDIPHSAGNIIREFAVLKRPQVLLTMMMSVLASASLFSVFTYIAPLLRDVTGLAPHTVTYVLLLFGVGITIGNLLGGRLADWRLMPSLMAIFVGLAAVLVVFVFVSPFAALTVATVFVWGILVFAVVAPIQMRVVDAAIGAPNLASTLNQGAFNLGNASGAWIGGAAITFGVGYAELPWVGAVLAVGALGLCVLSQALERRSGGLVPAAACEDC
ncbi:major facilitator superfamily MFS_1 [Ancylobacter novellus DSM 506]|uniref:Major facilitator superfamily MFS_1 n=1 Tax=Ancylobacter novellus (strain ATCC 8093 / DSM 506 / JCM 20403 / CCM 1077 / IAM 12100 / NBRC 12443 / NCIMB 10456) TaxID=639283 RepID=D7A666_ANCN5|nr:MFS transporter [Ancylobacter novellus]ADH88216.1 major facilitator superfamily MFS_1 [Ancylobacter novellus DSM 506]